MLLVIFIENEWKPAFEDFFCPYYQMDGCILDFVLKFWIRNFFMLFGDISIEKEVYLKSVKSEFFNTTSQQWVLVENSCFF